MKTVVGVIGEASSGKGELVRFLQEDYSFVSFSLSEILRSIATVVDLSHDRGTLTKIGNSFRATFGENILARGAKRMIEDADSKRFAVESIRHPSEVKYLQQELNAFIIGVTMPPERRFELMRARGRDGDPETWEDFLKLYAKEQGIGESKSGLQVRMALELADVVIPNEGSLTEFYTKVYDTLSGKGIIEGNHRRPESR